LKKATILLRRCVKKSIELKRSEKRRVRPIHFVPFTEQMKYSDKNMMPLKAGDIIFIDELGFQKENYRPMYKICFSEEIKTGIDWDTGLVSCRKMDLKNEKLGKTYIWQLDWIVHVIDGRQKSLNIDYISDQINEEIRQFEIESYGNTDFGIYYK
jgi:hypothetical protein